MSSVGADRKGSRVPCSRVCGSADCTNGGRCNVEPIEAVVPGEA